MLKYFTSIFFMISVVSLAQQSNQKPSDSLKAAVKPVVHQEKYGIRFGVDLSKPLRAFLDENYKGLELAGDLRISKKIFVAAEIGSEEKNTKEDFYSFFTKGSYIKAGIDYNTYENWYGMQNVITAGGRLGVASFSQTLNDYKIYNTNQYWGESALQGSELLGNYDGLTAQWLEFVLGIKAELFANIYLGGSVRLHFLLNDSEAREFPNLYIPGFNKVTDDSRFGVGYNYTITYMLPIVKKAKNNDRKKEKRKKEKKD